MRLSPTTAAIGGQKFQRSSYALRGVGVKIFSGGGVCAAPARSRPHGRLAVLAVQNLIRMTTTPQPGTPILVRELYKDKEIWARILSQLQHLFADTILLEQKGKNSLLRMCVGEPRRRATARTIAASKETSI